MANDKKKHVHPTACVAQSSVTGVAGAAATFTFADPGDGLSIVVGSVSWSYDADPTGGAITISDGTTSVGHKVTKSGPGFIVFDPPLFFADSTAVTVVAAAPGGSILATVHAAGYKQAVGQSD